MVKGNISTFDEAVLENSSELLVVVVQSDEELTTYSRNTLREQSCAAKTKRWLEKRSWRKYALLILVIAGSCMVIGDGVLTPPMSDVVVVIAVVILVVLFSVQHLGIDRVIWIFAPIVFIWLFLIGGVGIFNIWKYDSSVLRTFSPVYVYRFFKKGDGWTWPSLGGIMLCITGTEALFADLSQFPVLAIQIIFAAVVFPCLLLGYIGQAAYLMQNMDKVYDAFYHSIPSFHIYIPKINWILWFSALLLLLGLKINTKMEMLLVGIADIMVMLLTTFLMVLVMLIVWYCHWILVLIFTALSLIRWMGSAFDCSRMSVWHYGTVKHHQFELHSKVSIAWILGLCPSLRLVRVPGVGLVYTKLPSGVPRIFSHFITNNLSAIHYVVIFVCIKYLHVYTVSERERYLRSVRLEKLIYWPKERIGPNNFYMFHCVARYCYKYQHKDDDFEKNFFENLFRIYELEFLKNSRDVKVVHILGNQVGMAPVRGSSLYKKKMELITFILFLGSYVEKIPHECLLNVGQVIFV
ncbi:hypothetical protein ACOSP7_013266 [Xanthoceras sorbifolium]